MSHQENFNNNSIFATGLKEIFSKLTTGYKPNEHISMLFNAICNCNGFDPNRIDSLSEQLIIKANSFTKDDLNKFLEQIKNDIKENSYYSRINSIGIYKLVTELSYYKDLETTEINTEITKISGLLGYQNSRVEKDISIYKSNIDKMKQALEIMELNSPAK